MGLLAAICTSSCKNPFAPDVDFSDKSGSFSVFNFEKPENLLKNLQYAYTMKDTLIYGKLLHPDFVFTYRDYELGFDVSWGRLDEMKTTAALFANAEKFDLIWNNIISENYYADSTEYGIVRGFNLTVTFNPSDVVRIDGRVNMKMVKETSGGTWKISSWLDESNN
ncbi:MAG: hypothetical protein HY965_02115 [Ignavibacteriales bacterium]|nr:hypothetical protein [Ignavibacteriales bacterium]